jgi:hypothetical protein
MNKYKRRLEPSFQTLLRKIRNAERALKKAHRAFDKSLQSLQQNCKHVEVLWHEGDDSATRAICTTCGKSAEAMDAIRSFPVIVGRKFRKPKSPSDIPFLMAHFRARKCPTQKELRRMRGTKTTPSEIYSD